MAHLWMRRERALVKSERGLLEELQQALWFFRQNASGTAVDEVELWESMILVAFDWLETCLVALEELPADAD